MEHNPFHHTARPNFFCVECDGDITCFETGHLPPVHKDPKQLGICFPCCSKNKSLGHKNQMNMKEQVKVKPQKKGYSKTKPFALPMPHTVNTSLLYICDQSGVNKMIALSKAEIDCVGSENANEQYCYHS